MQPSLLSGGSDAAQAKGTQPDLYAETTYADTAGWHALQALVDGRWKLIASSEAELYDLSVDPGEQHNIAGTKDPLAQGMRTRAREIATAAAAATPAVSAEASERLRALGYVSGSAAPVSDTADNPADHI